MNSGQVLARLDAVFAIDPLLNGRLDLLQSLELQIEEIVAEGGIKLAPFAVAAGETYPVPGGEELGFARAPLMHSVQRARLEPKTLTPIVSHGSGKGDRLLFRAVVCILAVQLRQVGVGALAKK